MHRHLKIPLRSVGVVLDISAAVKWRFNPTNFKCMFLLGRAERERGRAYFSCPLLDPKKGGVSPRFPATISFFSSQRKKRNKRFWLWRRIPIFLPFSGEISFPHSVSAPMRRRGEMKKKTEGTDRPTFMAPDICGVKLGRLDRSGAILQFELCSSNL